VLCHLIRIAEYLISNLDEQTGCLHILYGDWNDAVDGLGRTTDKDKQFGTGVSVMATLQLYKNLNELCEILRYTGKDGERIERYESIANNILAGLKKYAIAENGKGEKKVVHGWGDKLSYKIGSFCDNDGVSRDSATANAFWVLSGVNDSMDMKEHIVKAYERMDSKYGIKTFEPYFAPENKDVGRITSLPKGTAENGATYIHGTLFTIWSLFEMGEYDKAWEQIFKILPITHELISTSPFVMPNSYAENPEQGMDGESMSDWFTGSGCVLGKVLFFCVFGVRPNLQGVEICPAINKKFNKLQTTLSIKGGEITVIYKYTGQGKRTFTVNGNAVCGEYVAKYGTDKITLSNEEVAGKKLVVEICD
jgi:cellobiose phosphorylase